MTRRVRGVEDEKEMQLMELESLLDEEDRRE